MRKFILTVMASLLSCSAVSAFWPEATDSLLEIGVGYRNDSLKWKNNDKFYEGYSEYNFPLRDKKDFHWKNLNIWLIEARGHYVTCDCIYLRGSIDYGWITSGKLHTKDNFGLASSYACDDESYFSRDGRASAKGNVYDAKLAIGYEFKWCDDALSIAPVVGYGWNGQHIKHHNNSRSFRGDNGEFDYYGNAQGLLNRDGRETKFNTRWNGPFIGFDLAYNWCCDWNFFLDYEYHWVEYHAKRHQSFDDCSSEYSGYYSGYYTDYYSGYPVESGSSSSDFFNDRFSQHARNGSGNFLDFGFNWAFCECWTVGLRAEFQWFYAGSGHQRFKFYECRNGNTRTDCFLKEKLKDIEWTTAGIFLEVGMVF